MQPLVATLAVTAAAGGLAVAGVLAWRRFARAKPREALAGRYEFVKPLPRGPIGEAWLANDRVLARSVAVNAVREPWARDRAVMSAFLRDARAAGRLNHPHVLALHDVVDLPPDDVALVMEHVEGSTVAARLESGKLLRPDAVRIADEILAGLVVAHEARVYHGDLKPSLVLLTAKGRVKLAGFGLAHAPFWTARVRGAKVAAALPYRAPEQVLGFPPDARSDVYAVGAILVELLTGRHYLHHLAGHSPADIEEAIRDKPPRLDDPGISGPLRDFARRALAKGREERFQTAADMRRALSWAARAAP